MNFSLNNALPSFFLRHPRLRLVALVINGLIIFANTTSLAQSAVIDSLQREVLKHPNDTIGIRAAIMLASEFSRIDLPKSRQILYECLIRIRQQNILYGHSACYAQLTTSFQNTGQLDSARKYLDRLKDFAERHKRVGDLANYHNTAGLFHKNMSQFDLALPHMEKALTYMTGEENRVSAAGQKLNIGNAFGHIGDVNKAAYYHLEALKEFLALKNKRGESFCLQSLGGDFLKLKRYNEAADYFKRSLVLKQELSDARGQVAAWNGLGNVYVEMKKYAVALDSYQKALKGAQELKLQSEELKALHDIGSLHAKTNRKEEAKIVLTTAMPLARKRGDSLMVSRINTVLAQVAQDEHNFAEVESALIKKLESIKVAGDRHAMANNYYDLAEHYHKHGEPDKAYFYLKQFQSLSDSIAGKEVALRFTELEQHYQNERKEQEIALLKKDQMLAQAIIAKQNANQQIIVIVLISVIIIAIAILHFFRMKNRARRVREVEMIRNGIARDLHDDIGSTLSSIHIMSQLAMKQGGATTQLQRISDSAVKMMEGMSDIVWSINPENDSIEKLIAKMKEFASEILEPKSITYGFEIHPNIAGLKLDVARRKNLFLIFKESLNNAAKYSEGSNVTIRISLENGKLHMTVKDDGKGFQKNAVRTGNGLINMEARARNVKGNLIQNTVAGGGTEIIAEMPIT